MDKNIIQIPNNLRIGSKPTKELINEGVPANSALIGAIFYFEIDGETVEHHIVAEGCTFEYVRIEKVEPVIEG